MNLLSTGIFYLLLGGAVGLASCLRETQQAALSRALRALLTALFWPLYLPMLLGGPREAAQPLPRQDPRVHRAAQELLLGLQQLGRVAEAVLLPEVTRIHELGAWLHRVSERRAEMDRLLTSPEFDAAKARERLAELSGQGLGDDDPRVGSLRMRVRNIERLTALRDRTAELLERTLLKLEELNSQVLLLRFAENPEREVADLMRDLATSVDGLTEGLAATA